jgi:hypothetical protein
LYWSLFGLETERRIEFAFIAVAILSEGAHLTVALPWFQERAVKYYNGMTKEQFANMQKFIRGRSSKAPSKL